MSTWLFFTREHEDVAVGRPSHHEGGEKRKERELGWEASGTVNEPHAVVSHEWLQDQLDENQKDIIGFPPLQGVEGGRERERKGASFWRA